jgi:hypothetical protein
MTMAESPVAAVVRYIAKGDKESAFGDLIKQGLRRREALGNLRTEKEAAMAAITGEQDGLTCEASLGLRWRMERTRANRIRELEAKAEQIRARARLLAWQEAHRQRVLETRRRILNSGPVFRTS